jgi:uncharacterized protein (DUF433 family)
MSVKAPVSIATLIESTPGVKGGRPCLAGTGMSVHAVAARYKAGLSAQEILDQFPDLDLARIYAALAYYHANRDRIEADFREDERLYDELAAKYPQGWTRKTDRP